ncbi:Uma2 family endonuclease [Falsiroseomonas oryzae]|uniref:Uma2 family endonuclease n=1 Tax=Falsiroseomonas oryzae TaxID=2766473 RepID=UPI0022EB30E0|nr:Uma2 family endonuclease [Roseomonas sp. MO-31]
MSERVRDRWTWDAYLEWEAKQDVRHEFVDGEVRAVTGGTLKHNLIARRLGSALDRALGGGCRVHGPDVKVATGNGNARYPDILVDCGRFVPTALVAQDPVAVFEVLSRSTAWVDQGFKLRDYDATPSIRYYVLISQDELRAMLYVRNDAGRLDIRDAQLIEGTDGAIGLPSLGVTLTLGALHEGLEG